MHITLKIIKWVVVVCDKILSPRTLIAAEHLARPVAITKQSNGVVNYDDTIHIFMLTTIIIIMILKSEIYIYVTVETVWYKRSFL